MLKNYMMSKKQIIICAFCVSVWHQAQAQLSSNPDKFLGNITTSWDSDMDHKGFVFSDYWNQVTPENATKWASVQGNRSWFNWGGADKAYKYATEHGFPFKFHTFVWGSQFPDWVKNLSAEERYDAIVKWMDEAKKHFPDLEMIDVVNEAVENHQEDSHYMKEALGGSGITGYDWIIRSFEMVRERWPNAILIYNDYNVLQWDTDKFIDLVSALRNAGAPIDAYGCQAHCFTLNECPKNTLKNTLGRIQRALKMPMYITEYDIDFSNDADQKRKYEEQIPLFWEAEYCAGVTLWGWFLGETWRDNTGLIRNGEERAALKWLREYMQTDAAKNAKSPFPGMKKEASVYVKAAALAVSMGEAVPIDVNAKLNTKEIERVEVYVNNVLCATLTEAPYSTTYTPADAGKYDIKAVVVAKDGSTYERLSGFRAYSARAAYKGVTEIPGTLEFEDFDSGAEGFSYHDSDAIDEGKTNYRSDNEGVDIVTGNDSYAIGYTAPDEWLEYTIDVKEAGEYDYECYVASGNTGAAFNIDVVKGSSLVNLCNINVPQTDNGLWSTYKAVKGTFKVPLEAGTQRLRVTITSPYGNLDKLVLRPKGSSGISERRLADGDMSKTGVWYTLDGRQINGLPTYKGVYILNGKKVVVN